MPGSKYQYGFHYGSGGAGLIDLPVADGVVFWVDGLDDNTFTLNVNDRVQVWEDKSGFNHDVIQNSVALRPTLTPDTINGHQAVVFDGSNDQILNSTFVDLDVLTVFVVGEYFAPEDTQALLEIGNGVDLLGFRFTYIPDESEMVGKDTSNHSLTFEEPQSLHIYTGLLGDGSIDYFLDGVLRGSDGFTTITDVLSELRLGGLAKFSDFRLDGSLGEVIIYNRRLTVAEQKAMELYLAIKWGFGIPPLLLPNNVLWLDGQDPLSLTDVGGGEISGWADKSGEGNDVTQATSADRPILIPDLINGRPGLEFDGDGDFLENTSFQSFNEVTIFAIGMYRDFEATVLAERMVDISGGASTSLDLSRVPGLEPGSLTQFDSVTDRVVFDKPRIYVGVSDGATRQYYVDGALKGSGVTAAIVSSDAVTIGADISRNIPLKGSVGEIIVYDRKLSNIEISLITNSLADKWNVKNIFNSNDDIPGKILWLDSVDKTTLDPFPVNSLMPEWRDKSGLDNDVEQATVGKQPILRDTEANGAINNLPTIVFDGVDDVLDGVLPDMNTLTMINVFRYGVNFQQGAIQFRDGANPAVDAVRFESFSNSSAFVHVSNSVSTGGAVAEIPQLHVYTGVVTSSTAEYYLENSLRTVDSVNPFTMPLNSVSMGDGDVGPFDGAIGESLAFDRFLEDTERETIVKYLASKWDVVNPTVIPGCILWLDAPDAFMITEVDGAASRWKDKSGNGNDVVQDEAPNKPNSKSININGLPAIKFDGVNDLFDNADFPLIETFSIFIVAEYVGTGSQTLLYLGDGGTPCIEFVYTGTQSRVELEGGVTFAGATGLPKANIFTGILNNRDPGDVRLEYYLNGILKADVGASDLAGDTDTLTIGSSLLTNFLEGYTGEIVIFDRTLTDNERDYMHEYLSEKWAFLNVGKIQGNILWLDGHDDGMVVRSGSDVSQWTDKSPEGNSVVQSTAALKPLYNFNLINNLNVLDFDGVDDYLESAIITSTLTKFSIFIVAQYDSGGADQTILDFIDSGVGADSGIRFDYSVGFGRSMVGVKSGGVFKEASKAETPKLHIYAATLDDINLRYFIDDATAPVFTTPATTLDNVIDKIFVGAEQTPGDFFKGPIGEIIVINREVSDTERATMFSYLTRKWKILDVASLPGNELWLDAVDLSTVSNPGGSDIDLWEDKSGQGHDVSQSVAANKPSHAFSVGSRINSLPSMVFDGVDDFLENTSFTDLSNTDLLLCLVAEYGAGTAKQSAFQIGESGAPLGEHVHFKYQTFQSMFIGGDEGSPLFFTEPQSLHIYTGITTSSFQEYYIDGELKDSNGEALATDTWDQLLVGKSEDADFEFDGPIGEIIVLTDTSLRAEVEAYLSNKWRIQLKG